MQLQPDQAPSPPRRYRSRRSGDKRIEPYHGYGTSEVLHLKGRVHHDAGVGQVSASDHRWRNLWNTVRRIRARGAAGVRVRAHFDGQQWESTTDAGGYYAIEAVLNRPVEPGRWHATQVELVEPSGGRAVRANAHVLVASADAEFGVISDIDDTIVHTNATSTLQMLRIVLLSNAHGRMPFEQVDELYRALQVGADEAGFNPIFYVSSSPWNLYDLLEEFFRVHGIPEGPLFLRDWDFSPRKLLRMGHQEHKLVQIERLFELYPAYRWVLIGDSGQEDPEIYREVVRKYRDRVLAIYIRDVTTARRDREVHAIAEEVCAMGVEMALVEDKAEAAVHAARHGLISQRAAERLRRPTAADRS
jgi:phosphatidate phosphatase APP1